jgi:hypothetical protein
MNTYGSAEIRFYVFLSFVTGLIHAAATLCGMHCIGGRMGSGVDPDMYFNYI